MDDVDSLTELYSCLHFFGIHPSHSSSAPSTLSGLGAQLLSRLAPDDHQTDRMIMGAKEEPLGVYPTVLLLTMVAMLSLQSSYPSASRIPSHLAQFQAQYILISILHTHAPSLEKAPYKNYSLSVIILRALLCSPGKFSASRRAKWYRRLSVNLHVHLKETVQSVYILQAAIKDDCTKLGDAVDFRKRRERLRNLMEKMPPTRSHAFPSEAYFSTSKILSDLQSFLGTRSAAIKNTKLTVCSKCTYLNTPSSTTCDICLTPLLIPESDEGMPSSGPIDLVSDGEEDHIEVFSRDEIRMSSSPLGDDKYSRDKCGFLPDDVDDENSLSEQETQILGIKNGNIESAIKVLTIKARRFGSTSKRGKNVFCGILFSFICIRS